ncbi:tetratricopeptide repeat protein [bacterium]|nr:tetratricopeptide repeat protein [bacterium]
MAVNSQSDATHVFGHILIYLVAGIFAVFIPTWVFAGSLSEIWQAAIQAHLVKNYSQSIRLLEKYLQQVEDPAKSTSARFFLAENYRYNGQSSEALPIYQTLAVSGPAGPLKISARFREAELTYTQGDYRRAARILNRLANDSQADFLFPQIPLAQVKANLKLKRLSQARRVFAKLLQTFPRSLLDPEIKFLYGIMKEYQGNNIDALKIYEELGDNPLAWLFSGAILESQGRYLPAIEAYNQVIANAKIKSYGQMAKYFKIRAFYKSGDFLAAESLSRKFLSQYPKSDFRARTALLQLLILFAQARYEEMLDTYTGLAAVLDSLYGEDGSLVDFILAEAVFNIGSYQEAIEFYEEALPLTRPNRAEILLRLAYVQKEVRNWEQSYKRINEYFRATKNPDPLGYLIATQANLATGREQGAFQAVRALAKSQAPLAHMGLYFLAAYYQDKGKPQKLVSHWALLEKDLDKCTLKPEYREVASWARTLVAEAYYQERNFLLARKYYQLALELYPHGRIEMHSYSGLAWCSFKLQDYNDVQVISERLLALKQVPEDLATEISLIQAHASFNLQQYDKAIHTYQNWLKAVGNNPAVPTVYFQIGWAHYLSKDYLDAVETWKDLARQFPHAPETRQALFWVADTYFQAGENSRARLVYEEISAKYPDSPEQKAYALRIAQTYYNEQQDAEAIRRFTAILEKYPKTEEAQEAKSGIEAASYRIADQLNTIPVFREFIEKFPGSNLAEDIQYRIGEAYFTKEKYTESLEEFLQFVLVYTKSPRTPNAQYYISVCQEQVGNILEAVLQAEAFINNYPQHELAAEIMFRLASGEFQLERYAAAAGHFAACAENYSLQEYQPRAWYNAAVTYEKIQLPDQALIYYGKLVATFPQDANAGMSLSRLVMLNAARQNQEGIAAALKLMQKQQDKALLQKTWLGLAVIYKEQGKAVEQEQILKKVMAKGLPKSEEYSLALVELAAIYEQQKAWQDAMRVYQRLAKTTTQVKWRQAAKKRIKLLRRILKSK